MKKLKELSTIIAAFAALIYLGQNTYLLEWLAERYFCFMWIPILVLWVLRQTILSRWLTAAAFGGLLWGQLAEDMKWYIFGMNNQMMHSSYWGVGIWFTTIILFFGFGILHTWLNIRKKQKNISTN